MYQIKSPKYIKVSGQKVPYRVVTYCTDAGAEFLDLYQYMCPEGVDSFEVEQTLIQKVIGEDRYYRNRSVWEQIWFRPVESFTEDNL
jgi:hypothetical protein